MAGEQEILHGTEDLTGQSPSRVAHPVAPSVSIAELGEAEAFFRAAESNALAEPTLERWTQFNERVMADVAKSTQQRPTLRQRWQTFLDRLTASDSRLKGRAWTIVAMAIIVVIAICTYFFLIR